MGTWREDPVLGSLMEIVEGLSQHEPDPFADLKVWLGHRIAELGRRKRASVRPVDHSMARGHLSKASRDVPENVKESSRWLTSKEAALYLRLSEKTLANYRGSALAPLGPRFYKRAGLIRYRSSDLDEWLSGR